MSKPFEDVLKEAESLTFTQLVNSYPSLKTLLDISTDIFERYDYGPQLIAMAILFGMCTATIEGETTEYEMEHGRLIGFEERLKLFEVQARITFNASMEARRHPDCPQPRERCEGRYLVPQTSPPRDEPFDVTYRCGLMKGHKGPHGVGEPPQPKKARVM